MIWQPPPLPSSALYLSLISYSLHMSTPRDQLLSTWILLYVCLLSHRRLLSSLSCKLSESEKSEDIPNSRHFVFLLENCLEMHLEIGIFPNFASGTMKISHFSKKWRHWKREFALTIQGFSVFENFPFFFFFNPVSCIVFTISIPHEETWASWTLLWNNLHSDCLLIFTVLIPFTLLLSDTLVLFLPLWSFSVSSHSDCRLHHSLTHFCCHLHCYSLFLPHSTVYMNL